MSNDFVLAGVVEAGKLNTMVKNIMAQMGVDDVREAVRRINSGEWVVAVRGSVDNDPCHLAASREGGFCSAYMVRRDSSD